MLAGKILKILLPVHIWRQIVVSMVHVADAAKQYKPVTVCTADSDVFLLAVYVFILVSSLASSWVAFGKNFRMIPVLI